VIRNVLYLHCHDAGRWLGPYDSRFPTPNLHTLAAQGLTFDNAHCAAPTCSPSRAALLTGQWAHASGMLGLTHRGFSLAQPERHLARVLGDAGFDTHLCGIQHEFAHHLPLPYQTTTRFAWTGDERGDLAIASGAADFLKARSASSAPFFLSCGFFYPHREFPKNPGSIAWRDLQPPPCLPDTPAVRFDMGCYTAAAVHMDTSAGIVLDALRASGLADSTLVIFTTDHGPAFPHMKCNLTGLGTGVSLILAGPGVPGGVRTRSLASHVDMFPTICELTGVQPPAWLQGTSLAPLLTDPKATVREETFAEVTYHAAYEPARGIRTSRWNYIRRLEPRNHPVLPNCDDGYTKIECLSRGWRNNAQPEEELYDLVADPHELRNLAGDPALTREKTALANRLAQWMRESGDPALAGLPVPRPSGAVVNPVDGLSPTEPTS
jgi:arylsulfatase A-like enzyme